MTAPKVKLLRGQDVMTMLTSIYLDGFASGTATLAMTGGATGEQADDLAQSVVDQLQADPIAMLAIEQEIAERLNGADGGPGKSVKAAGA